MMMPFLEEDIICQPQCDKTIAKLSFSWYSYFQITISHIQYLHFKLTNKVT